MSPRGQCPVCRQYVRVRKDGTLGVHYRIRGFLRWECSGTGRVASRRAQ